MRQLNPVKIENHTELVNDNKGNCGEDDLRRKTCWRERWILRLIRERINE